MYCWIQWPLACTVYHASCIHFNFIQLFMRSRLAGLRSQPHSDFTTTLTLVTPFTLCIFTPYTFTHVPLSFSFLSLPYPLPSDTRVAVSVTPFTLCIFTSYTFTPNPLPYPYPPVPLPYSLSFALILTLIWGEVWLSSSLNPSLGRPDGLFPFRFIHACQMWR